MRRSARCTQMKASSTDHNSEAQILSFVCHELRSPVQKIVATVDLLALMDLPPDAHKAIQRLDRSACELARTLSSIARFHRASAGMFAEQLETVVLPELVLSAADEARDSYPDGPVIETILDEQLAGKIEVDRDRLKHILSNYVLNAVRHGTGPLVRIVARCNQSLLRIEVTNSGRFNGPRSDPLDWRPFERGNVASGEERGMGLGLVVVKLLAGQVDWEIGLSDEAASDTTTFFVQLPFRPAAQQL